MSGADYYPVHFNRPNGDTSTYWMSKDTWDPSPQESPRVVDKSRRVPTIKLSMPVRRYIAHQACASFAQSVSYPHGAGSPSRFNQEVQRMLLDTGSTVYSRRARAK